MTPNGTLRNTPTSVSTNRLTSGVYDVGGSLTSWNGAAYGYDRLNMPTQICSSGTLAAGSGENWLFAYTADDERILEYRVGGGAFRTSLRDLSGKILREYRVEAAANWSSFEDFIYRDSTLLASVHPTEGTRWFGPDHLGTPRAVFNSAGSVIGLHTYYPFGEEATAGTQDTQQMKFTGHERDLLSTPTGTADDTDYMHARQFSIQTARFHSFDPVGGNPRAPQSWNRYAYVVGNPLKYTDPFGLNMSSCDVNLGPCPPWNPPFWEEETITVTGSASPFGPGGAGYAPWLWLLFNGGPRAGDGQGGSGSSGGAAPTVVMNRSAQDPELPETAAEEGCSVFDSTAGCVAKCGLDQLGLRSVLGAGGVASGWPMIPKRFGGETSVISRSFSSVLPQRLPMRVWAPTLASPAAESRVLGRVLGRWVPYVGGGLLFVDAIEFSHCVDTMGR